MPKIKTNRAAAKRFKKTGTGKLKRNKAYKSHILTKKTAKRKRNGNLVKTQSFNLSNGKAEVVKISVGSRPVWFSHRVMGQPELKLRLEKTKGKNKQTNKTNRKNNQNWTRSQVP